MKKLKNILIITCISFIGILLYSCQSSDEKQHNLKDIAYDAFIYAYPMMEQVKTVNGMQQFLGMEINKFSMNPKLPWENVGQPIEVPNLTTMTGGFFIDISHGPVAVELPEVKDRYIVYQCIDVFTHNFLLL